MKQNDCPKFSRCAANICPIDSNWSSRNHVKGEAICPFILDAAKTRTGRKKTGSVWGIGGDPVGRHLKGILSRYAPIKKAFLRASVTDVRLPPNRQNLGLS